MRPRFWSITRIISAAGNEEEQAWVEIEEFAVSGSYVLSEDGEMRISHLCMLKHLLELEIISVYWAELSHAYKNVSENLCYVCGELMDDAMILPCGHSFGSGGMQHVSRMAYLSLPEGIATAAGLIAMLTDHYNILFEDVQYAGGKMLHRLRRLLQAQVAGQAARNMRPPMCREILEAFDEGRHAICKTQPGCCYSGLIFA
ncbi:uncharacterized protein A4U43_C07F32600 [Asparagus officinalis]|uniref:Uncharacterized protein n=1 Tax=Asparagus officinalis TaxID=4686 RepID=A0A5P1EGJ2_ASPOF|nr:uncharacterized protein A4U43_C07F32600 [Asparagus officinalis]